MPTTRFEIVKFSNARGLQLAGRFDRPEGPIHAVALFAHCFSCSKDLLAASRIAQALTEQGFAVLRFDFAGLGGSEGDFADTNFSSNVEDLVSAAQWLEQAQAAPSLLIGHSLGGAAVVAATSSIPSARAVATVGAPSNTENVLKQFAEHVPRIENEGEAKVLLAGRPFRITRQFVENVRLQDITGAARQLGRPFMVFHAPGDKVVTIDHAAALYTAAHHPKSFISLDDADHLLTQSADARFVGTMVATWARRYMEGAPVPAAS